MLRGLFRVKFVNNKRDRSHWLSVSLPRVFKQTAALSLAMFISPRGLACVMAAAFWVCMGLPRSLAGRISCLLAAEESTGVTGAFLDDCVADWL